jgi:hypothetical protein
MSVPSQPAPGAPRHIWRWSFSFGLLLGLVWVTMLVIVYGVLHEPVGTLTIRPTISLEATPLVLGGFVLFLCCLVAAGFFASALSRSVMAGILAGALAALPSIALPLASVAQFIFTQDTDLSTIDIRAVLIGSALSGVLSAATGAVLGAVGALMAHIWSRGTQRTQAGAAHPSSN